MTDCGRCTGRMQAIGSVRAGHFTGEMSPAAQISAADGHLSVESIVCSRLYEASTVVRASYAEFDWGLKSKRMQTSSIGSSYF
jgi:hypothetical protein